MTGPESHEQDTSPLGELWTNTMANIKPFESQVNAPSKQSTDPETPKDSKPLEAMITSVESDGYQPTKIGEHTVLSRNPEGKIRIESQYRQLWNDAAHQDPDFYNNPANQEISITLWNLSNSAMFQDLNPDQMDDPKTFQKLYHECTKLKSLMANPDYEQRAASFLNQLEDLGEAGANIVAVFDIASESKLSPNSAPAIDPELQRKQEFYDKLDHYYAETMSAPTLDTDSLDDLAKAYRDLGDFADSKERLDTIQSLLDRLESITAALE